MKKQRTIGLGGTFDHFHAGHEQFLKFAAQLGTKLVIGVAQPQLTKSKLHSELIQSPPVRKKAVHKFCQQENILAEITDLNDVFGPTLERSNIYGLCVTRNTLGGAEKINQVRQKMGLKQLEIFECPLFKDESGQILSSSRIRVGEVNRQGQVYQLLFKLDQKLTAKQRHYFTLPQGNLIEEISPHAPGLKVVVGDTSLEKFMKRHWAYDLGVFDGRVMRHEYHSPLLDKIETPPKSANPPGLITAQLAQDLVSSLINKTKHLFVTGEEDLAAVALMLLLPLGSRIYYGQPKDGLVEMIVTEQKKDAFYHILQDRS